MNERMLYGIIKTLNKLKEYELTKNYSISFDSSFKGYKKYLLFKKIPDETGDGFIESLVDEFNRQELERFLKKFYKKELTK